MDWKNIALIFVAIANLVLGLLTLYRNKEKKVNQEWFLFTLTVAFWTAAIIIYRASDPQFDIFTVKTLYIGALFIPLTLLNFLYDFPREKKFNVKRLIVSIVATTPLVMLIVLIMSNGLVIRGVEAPIGQEKIILWGSYYPFYVAYIVTYFSASSVVLMSKYKKAKGLLKAQMRYMLLGISISVVIGTTFNLILPTYNVFRFNWLGQIGTLIMVFFITYAIIRHRLLDITLVAKNSTVYIFYVGASLVMGIAGWLFADNILKFSTNWSALFALTLAVVVSHPIRKMIHHLSNKYFFSSLYSSQDTIKSLSAKLSSMIKLEEVVNVIIDTVINTMRLEKMGVLLMDNQQHISSYKEKRIANQNTNNKKLVIKDTNIVDYLIETKKPIVYDELSYFINQTKSDDEKKRLSTLKERMKEMEASVCLPLISKNKLVSIILLGKKISHEPFSKNDLALLETLSNQAAIAIENARLYNNMEEMVEAQTKDITDKAEHLKKLLEMRSEFLDVTSHQLRTPVSVIKGTLSLMKEADFEKLPREQQLEFINSIYRKSEKLESIISDILSASEMDSDKFIVKVQDQIKIEELIKDIVSDFSQQAYDKNIKLTFAQPATPLPLIKGSKRYLEHAVNNLVSNALRYTKQGSITVSAFTTTDTKEKNPQFQERLMITVKDTGIGIPKDALPKLFDKFVRAQNARDMYTDGSGLGLFIVKKSIHAHPDGKVWVESEGEGKGSTFFISLPLHPPEI